MIKIIKHGTRKEAECQKCGAILSYDENEDVEIESVKDFNADMAIEGFKRTRKYIVYTRKYIVCPQCHSQIILNETR